MRHNFRSTTLFVVAVSMMMGMALMTACGKNGETQKVQEAESSKTTEVSPETESTVEETADNDMRAPEIKPNEAGLIVLSQCPTNYQNLKVEVSRDYTEAKIYDGDKLLQTISDPDNELVGADGEVPVYFLDANFDGYVDIFIGPGVSRTYSTLLTWNPVDKKFVRVGELGSPALQNFMLYPSEKNVFDGGSESAYAEYFTRSAWKDGKLQILDDLYIVNDPEQYLEYGVESQYSIRDVDGKVLLSTDKLSELPKPWANALKTYTAE
jgi:hypothetical protein